MSATPPPGNTNGPLILLGVINLVLFVGELFALKL